MAEESKPRRFAKVSATGRRLNQDPRLLGAVQRLRGMLPGDSRFGDPLSVAGDKQSDVVGRRLSELTAERPGVLREAGLGALQVWQAVSEAQGRGRGEVELTILFTDLVDGMMAVFADSSSAVDAVDAARAGVAEIEAEGYRPAIRAGIHRGQPRRIGGDYLGVDVNIAARIAEQAGAGELLVSDRVIEELSEDSVRARKKRLFRGKGVPKDMTIYSLEPS